MHKEHQEFSLESRIVGAFYWRFVIELFRNSAYFAIINIIYEMILKGPVTYLTGPDFYAISSAVLIQSYWLTKWKSHAHRYVFVGNLIGPAIYTVLEVAVEGMSFFSASNHIAFWVFSILIGAGQQLRFNVADDKLKRAVIIYENVLRSTVVYLMYMLLETGGSGIYRSDFEGFFQQSPHQYFIFATIFLGIGFGMADATGERYLALLKRTAAQLKTYSECLLGRKLLEKVILDSSALDLARRNRVVLFADIRGFTHWSERQSPEAVVEVLNDYFTVAEKVLSQQEAVKIKFTGDEVMAVFGDDISAAYAALMMRSSLHTLLSHQGMGLGIGIHKGMLMEGIIGAEHVKYYDVIGDTVNTAKGIEEAASTDEILISLAAASNLFSRFMITGRHALSIKGKSGPVTVFRLLSGRAKAGDGNIKTVHA